MHLKPALGTPRAVGQAIIDYMFPPENYKTFPVIGVTGMTGSTIVTRLMFHLLKQWGLCVGLANNDGLFVNERKFDALVSSNWSNAQRLLLNCQIEAAIVENDGIDILTQGLDYSQCLIGIVTDIAFNDIFQRQDVAYHNFETAEDLIKIYRTQIDVVSASGTGVLNADDPNVAAIAEFCKGFLTYFSLKPRSELIQSHLAEGKRAVLLEDDQIVLAEGVQRITLCAASQVRVLSASAAARQENSSPVLASVAGAWALGIPLELMRAGLATF